MPATFLSEAERLRYQQLPPVVPQGALRQHGQLSEADQHLLRGQRRDVNRLGCAVQLVVLRVFAHLPERWWTQVPAALLDFVAAQLPVDAGVFAAYGQREATVYEHFQQVLAHLGWRRWQPLLDTPGLETWLLERALEHDQERVLLELACQRLRQQQLVRPSVVELERLIGSLVERAHTETYQRLAPVLTPAVEAQLDALLVVEDLERRTRHGWLLQPPTRSTPATIRATLDKLRFLRALGAGEWNLVALHPNRQKRLAGLARHRSNQALQRLAPAKRYPLLLAFGREMLLELTDLVLKMADEYWETALARARREMEEYQRATARAKDQVLATLGHAVGLLLDEAHVPGEDLRAQIYARVPRAELQQALATAQALTQPAKRSYLEFLEAHYAAIKRFSAPLLADLDWENAFTGDDFFAALLLVRDLLTGTRRQLPAQPPRAFMAPAWQAFVGVAGGPLSVPAYALSVLATLRERLRSGDVYVRHSRKYASLDSYLIPLSQWPALRADACAQLGLPAAPVQQLDDHLHELEGHLPRMEQILQEGGDIRLNAQGELVVTPLTAAEVPVSAQELAAQVGQRLPLVELSELLGEVDAWTGFSRVLLGPEPVAAQRALLYAALLAAACNIPLTDMARSTGLDYQALWWVASNYLREDALKQATTCLVNYQYRQPLAAAWGGGTLSSSDGQRFPVRGHVRAARALPRYYGYGQGLTFYTHTADQYSQFGSRAIASTVRDATYVLDEVLGNETELPLLEHTTDTHGYTDLVFALFDLLGLRFSPRLRDLKDQRLCKIQGRDLVYPSLKFTARFHPEFVRRHWDELLRVAASLKLGYVTSSLLISKLQAYPRQHQLTTLLQEYGRLLKTNFILRYLQSQPLRRRIHAQLNKGEQLHALRSWLWFGGDGALRRQQDEQQQETVRCLNLLTNLVVVWNTRYMQEVVTQLRLEGQAVPAEDLRFLSPARYRHINRLGRYSFLPDETALLAGLRPLRTGA
jgi:TnpA family transposase